jgi:hypothetical protein
MSVYCDRAENTSGRNEFQSFLMEEIERGEI